MATDPVPSPDTAFLAGGGQMGALMRAHDWSTSPLGPPGTWPQSLRTAVSLMINSRHPMFIAWGPDLAFLYNDGYVPIFGAKHPHTLGLPFRQVWSEIWDDIWPLIARALAGEATWSENLHLVMERNGYPEDTWYTFSYSPIRDETGGVGGMFCACMETTAQVLAERRAAAERERLARMFEQAPGLIAMVSGPDHVFELANAGYRRLIGDRDIIGRPVREALPELVEQGHIALLDQVYRSGEPFIGTAVPTLLRRSPDGALEQRFFDFVYQPLTDGAGRVTGIFAEGQDVTERAEAQERLRESEARRGAALAAARLGTFEWNLRTGAVTLDERSCEIFGFASGEGCRAQEVFDRIHPDEVAAIHAQALASAESLSRLVTEYRVRLPDGTIRTVSSLSDAVAGADGKAERMVGVFEDISERKRAEAALRELNETLEAQVAQRTEERDRTWRLSRDMLAIFSLDGVLRRANPAWTAILGWRPDEIEGRHHTELKHPDDRERGNEAVARLAQGDSIADFEDRYRHKDGGYRVISWTAAAPEGDVVYAVGRDVTAERERQAQLEAAQEALRQAQKMEAVGQLTGGIAHDFNNLLAAVVGSLDLICRKPTDPERVQRFAEAGLRAAERGAKLTAQLLAFSRAQRMELKPVVVAELIDGMRDLLGRTLGPMVRMRFDLDKARVPVLSDATQLEMAVLNLAINARDAMADGGDLTIRTIPRQIRDDSELSPGEYVEVVVTDTGSGMPPDVMARAFEPFFTTKGVGKGTGLGLSQVYGIAKQAGGTVRIESRVGQGTTVRLFLPRTELPMRAGPEGPADRPAAARTGATILVVDDDPDIRRVLVNALDALGYRVLEAADGAAGLAALEQTPPDLMMVDFAMPGMNGAELAKAARRRRPNLPIVFASGYAETAALEEVTGPRAALLRKPFRIDELHAAVAEALNGRP